MPIRPSEKARYPKDWKAISARIRERAGGRCECAGECGLHRTTPGPRRCRERQGEPAKWAKGKVVLTVAHLDHTPENCGDDNLKAMCQRCHLRYDVDHHRHVYVLPNRPSFTGEGTDSIAYAWFVWGVAGRRAPLLRVLPTTPAAERRTPRLVLPEGVGEPAQRELLP